MNCSQLYAGATRDLREFQSAFISVERLLPSDADYQALAPVLCVPNIYYLASHAGCGCGWEYTGSHTEWDLRNLASRNALETYLRLELEPGPILLVSSCAEALGKQPSAWERRSVAELFAQFNGWRVLFGSGDVRIASLGS